MASTSYCYKLNPGMCYSNIQQFHGLLLNLTLRYEGPSLGVLPFDGNPIPISGPRPELLD